MYLLTSADGLGVDPRRSFAFDEADETLRRQLLAAGYVHVRGVFSRDEIARLVETVEARQHAARPGDGRSWWAKQADGTPVLCRLIYLGLVEPDIAALSDDPRLRRLMALAPEPLRAAAYRTKYELPCPVLCDPEHVAYRAYGVGQWQIERVLPDAAFGLSSHSHDVGVKFQNERRELGLPLVDDPWRAIKEFVIGSNGLVRLTYAYQHCEDYPNPRVLVAAARLS
jgi:hypothetical protein